MTVSGELGAGKTTFVRGASRALGVTAPVTSPTFTIGHRYAGSVAVSHLDLYRFTAVSPAEWADLEPYFDDAVVFVEWPEAGAAVLPPARVSVTLEHGGGDVRRVTLAADEEALLQGMALMLVLAFDTATDVATSALLEDGRVLGERIGIARSLLEDVHALLEGAGCAPADIDALVVGTGPGSFTSTRIGLAVARGLGLALDVPGAGVSTLAALASAEPGAFPIVDARRQEVFVEGPRAVAPDDVELDAGDGLRRKRRRALPRDLRGDRSGHTTRRRRAAHPACATPRGARRELGPVDAIEPIYVRVPDAEATLA